MEVGVPRILSLRAPLLAQILPAPPWTSSSLRFLAGPLVGNYAFHTIQNGATLESAGRLALDFSSTLKLQKPDVAFSQEPGQRKHELGCFSKPPQRHMHTNTTKRYRKQGKRYVHMYICT